MKPLKFKLFKSKQGILFGKDLIKMDALYFCRFCVVVLVLEICKNDARGMPSSSKIGFKESRGFCPSYIDNEVHSTHSQVVCSSSSSDCNNDQDCLIGLKCCSDGCVKKCTPAITENEKLENAHDPKIVDYNDSQTQECAYKGIIYKHNDTFINSDCRTCHCLNAIINCGSKRGDCISGNLFRLNAVSMKQFIKGKR